MNRPELRPPLHSMAGSPTIPAKPLQTEQGTEYFQSCGVALIAQTLYDHTALTRFIQGFDGSLDFDSYLTDGQTNMNPEKLVKTAGQLCYLSFGPKRSTDDKMEDYIHHILESGHGSVLEHANFTFLLYGVDRSLTHELVRHRAGFAFSQCSQRYTDGKTLRFVERKEFQESEILHLTFCDRIDQAARDYDMIASYLRQKQKDGDTLLSEESRTTARKKVNQVARACLPNETEAPIIVTANARAWRHFLTMRASRFAETAIRDCAVKVWRCLMEVSPLLFQNYTPETAEDGTVVLSTPYPKV